MLLTLDTNVHSFHMCAIIISLHGVGNIEPLIQKDFLSLYSLC